MTISSSLLSGRYLVDKESWVHEHLVGSITIACLQFETIQSRAICELIRQTQQCPEPHNIW
jgi:hypothetical protein